MRTLPLRALTVTFTFWVPREDVTTMVPDELPAPTVTVTIAGVAPFVGDTVRLVPIAWAVKLVPLPFTINVWDCDWDDPEGRLKTEDEGLATGPLTVDPPMTIETLMVCEFVPVENWPVVERLMVPVQVPAPIVPGNTCTVRGVAIDESCPLFGDTLSHPEPQLLVDAKALYDPVPAIETC